MYGVEFRTDEREDNKDENLKSLPIYYPKPKMYDDLVFYIQRNHNTNTILYEVNYNNCGKINIHNPLKIKWKRYADNGEIKELNYMQDKLVYGYKSNQINENAFEIKLIANDSHTFYLVKNKNNQYHLTTLINDEMCVIHNIYAYATELGVFPTIKAVEFYGCNLDGSLPIYHSIEL